LILELLQIRNGNLNVSPSANGFKSTPCTIIFCQINFSKNRSKSRITSVKPCNAMSDWTKPELEKKLSGIKAAVTVPVNIRVECEQRILDLSEMMKVLSEAKLISVGECICRKRFRRCDSPSEVCFSIDREAEKLMKRGLARKITLNEAVDVLKRTHEAGLVHMTFTYKGREKPEVICSCCTCCCHSMSALVRFAMPDAVVASKYVATVNLETCVNCGRCVSRCQFKAKWTQDGKVKFDRARCFGCGLCVSTCPVNAISLEPRPASKLKNCDSL